MLDFACGSGVSTAACARAGATALTAVDIDPFAVVATRVNGALEGGVR
ncbi:MAG: 50S ribosomal protein L11 methyltransferase [Archangiaceae bacterium]|nr:50S ribosomal protein L11 methyltransferase [Archangiaceae bacterium]